MIVIDVSFISLAKVLPAVLACAAERFDCLALVKPQFEVGRARVGKGGVVRSADDRRAALVRVGELARGLGCSVVDFVSSGLSGPAGNRESFAWITPGRRPAGGRAPGLGGEARRAVSAPRSIAVFTHQNPTDTSDALRRLLETAGEAGVEARLGPGEAEKHGLDDPPEDPGSAGDPDLAVVLGGDGTILTALRTFAGREVPVFAFNYGAIGFLATVDREDLDDGLRRVVSGDFEVVSMPALVIATEDGPRRAAGDVSFHRRHEARVAELAYSVEDEQLGKVRCDGLVASTPVGSTGYNLANGGPLLAWGVEGFVVSFIAPHSLTARGVVVAPDSPLKVLNCSDRDAVDVTTDGRIVCPLAPGDALEVRFEHDMIRLAQAPGSTFYRRLREKFGRIAY